MQSKDLDIFYTDAYKDNPRVEVIEFKDEKEIHHMLRHHVTFLVYFRLDTVNDDEIMNWLFNIQYLNFRFANNSREHCFTLMPDTKSYKQTGILYQLIKLYKLIEKKKTYTLVKISELFFSPRTPFFKYATETDLILDIEFYELAEGKIVTSIYDFNQQVPENIAKKVEQKDFTHVNKYYCFVETMKQLPQAYDFENVCAKLHTYDFKVYNVSGKKFTIDNVFKYNTKAIIVIVEGDEEKETKYVEEMKVELNGETDTVNIKNLSEGNYYDMNQTQMMDYKEIQKLKDKIKLHISIRQLIDIICSYLTNKAEINMNMYMIFPPQMNDKTKKGIFETCNPMNFHTNNVMKEEANKKNSDKKGKFEKKAVSGTRGVAMYNYTKDQKITQTTSGSINFEFKENPKRVILIQINSARIDYIRYYVRTEYNDRDWDGNDIYSTLTRIQLHYEPKVRTSYLDLDDWD